MSDLVSSDQVPHYKVKQCLRALGASPYTLSRPEVSKLSVLLHENEQIEAFVCGVYISGWALFVATDRKVLFIEKVFTRLKVEELAYEMIIGVDHTSGRKHGRVTVHSQRKDYQFRRVDLDCLKKFVGVVESRMHKDEESGVTVQGIAEAQSLDPRLNYSSSLNIPTPQN